ncbi:glycosyltransferase [Brevibacterium sp. XM4083]|uniref:glycosyltransferase n=1 Tax=Brevibacterium sp. XM4083 TaxID=2583238 RepID=UPI00112972F1|nr:glycosyltransferase [Brevibacterium sp. XM4083]MCM1012850.1 glycosyltransferase [Brevibacterium sp. XM4083]
MKILVYADISLNILDGSSIWLLSAVSALSGATDRVDLLLKESLYTSKLSHQVRSLENVTLLPPLAEGPLTVDSAAYVARLNPPETARRIAQIDEREHYDLIFLRGLRISTEVASRSELSSRTWAYVTDLPYPPSEYNVKLRDGLGRVAESVAVMVSQTEEARSYLEAVAPVAAGKTVLMPPMIPALGNLEADAQRREGVPVRICYAGKFAREWMTLELLNLPRVLARLGIASELWMIGDKFQGSKSDPEWPDRMRSALIAANEDDDSGVRYLGALSRDETIEIVKQCEYGVSWRSDGMDSSLELSTKVLEYLSAGVFPLVNNSRSNRELLGDSFAGYIPAAANVDDVALLVAKLNSTDAGVDVSEFPLDEFTVSAAASRLRDQFRARGFGGRDQVGNKKVSITFATHDPKFLREIESGFESDDRFLVRADRWSSLHTNDPVSSNSAARDSDVIFCEWAGPNLAWYARHKRPGQVLVCRFHGFEINGPWLRDIDFRQVDHLSFVSQHHRAAVVARFQLDLSRTSVISNAIDAHDLERPKLPGSEFNIGMLGFVPFLKRPDRALDLLEELIRDDDRYTLFIKGRPPWEYPHVWNDPLERQLYLEFFARVRDSAASDNLVFEAFSPNVGSWLRKIGIVVSPSERETFHLAAAEGMSSGSIPIVWDRVGARDIFGSDLVYNNLQAMKNAVLRAREYDVRVSRGLEMQKRAMAWSSERVVKTWKEIVIDSLSTPNSATNSSS